MNITGDVNVEIFIYSFTGQLVKTISEKTVESAGEIQVIPWDGYGENGKPLSNGIYPYRIILQGENESAMASQKIVIMR
jgi:flagellar hook assembly protein FlgD